MLLLGHIGLTTFTMSLLYLSVIGGVIGVLLPDVIDKGLFELGIAPCSRFIAHSIFFIPVAGLISYGVTRNKKFAIAIMIGILLHLLQDMHHDVPFIYPLKNYEFFQSCSELKISFTPYLIVTEIIGALALVFVGVFTKQFIKLRKFLWAQFRKVKKW